MYIRELSEVDGGEGVNLGGGSVLLLVPREAPRTVMVTAAPNPTFRDLNSTDLLKSQDVESEVDFGF